MAGKSKNVSRRATKSVTNTKPKKDKVDNSAFGFPGSAGAGFPFNQGSIYTEHVSEVGTIFKNLRYYLVSNFRQILSQAYVELGLIQTIVDVPVDDGLRGGVDIKSKQLDEEQISQLQASLDRDNDLQTMGQALKWTRLFGGAGILILTEQAADTPLDMNLITADSALEFRAVDMWELFWDQQNVDGYDPTTQTENFEFYNYYATKVHKSRVMAIKGMTPPSFIRPRLRGWGFSVVEALVRSINQYLKGTDLGFEVMDEFKIDVYKLKNLTNTLLSPNGQQKVRARVQESNYLKNYQNALVMDSEDDYDHKQLSFAGLAEAMAGVRMQVASDMRMPLTKLFGISAAGFNSGEDDIEVYNAMVESQVRNKSKYDILRMCEIKCQKLFGFVPDDMQVSFKPLRVMSAEQEENVKNAKFGRALQARQAGEITAYQFRECLNRDQLLGITVDNSGDSLNSDDPDVAALVEGQPADGSREDEGSRNPFVKNPVDDGPHDDAGNKEAEDENAPAKTKDAPEPKSSKPSPEQKDRKDPKDPNSDLKKNSDEFDESKHPRAGDGKFGKGGGSAESSGKSQGTTSLTELEREQAKELGIDPDKEGAKEAIADGVAVYQFTRGNYDSFMKADRDGTPYPLNDRVNEYLKKAPKFDGEIYRGLAIDNDKIESFLESFAEGNTVEMPTKASFSKDGDQAYARIFDFDADSGISPVLLRVPKSKSGVDITRISSTPSEKEVLVPKGTKYKVASVKKEGPNIVIDLEEVDPIKNAVSRLFFGSTYAPIWSTRPAFSDKHKLNSTAYDKAAYEVDGGDAQFIHGREPFFENPQDVDKSIWAKAKEESLKAYGKLNVSFVLWAYKKMGGTIHERN